DQKETIKKLETSNQKVKEDNAKLETKNEELREVNESAQKHANSAGGGCGLGLVSFGIGFGVGVFGKALVNTFIGGKQ
ncbi:MAG: hypothetical protein LBT64_03805, partial [Puniceicoccales bacterium]|nr:hypothetical protein [Puniceicoccales bacterium]